MDEAPTVKLATPHVYLVGTQTIDDQELDRFLADHGVESWETDTDVAGQKLIETAGRVCYWSFARPRPGGNRAYIDHILEVGHGSVLEHAVFNLVITGVSRSFTHELVRHRAGWSYSQLSQRFVDESSAEFVVPPALEREVALAQNIITELGADSADAAIRITTADGFAGHPVHKAMVGLRWLRAMERAVEDYGHLSDYLLARDQPGHGVEIDKTSLRKSAREAARSVLPNATETKIFVTGNARALRTFIEMRANQAADREIRRVAVMVLRALQDAAPNLFGDYVIEPSSLTGEEQHALTPYKKV